MKYTFLFVSLTLVATQLSGQSILPYNEDSLSSVLQSKQDTATVDVLLKLAGSYQFKDPATSLSYAQAALDSSRRLKFEKGIVKSLIQTAEANRPLGNFIEGLKMQREALELSKKIGDKNSEANSTGFIGIEYFELKHFEESISYLKKAVAMRSSMAFHPVDRLYNVYIARAYIETRKYDSARHFLKAAAPRTWTFNVAEMMTMYAFGDYYFHVDQTDSAYFYWMKALKTAAVRQNVVPNLVSRTSAKLSKLFSLKNQLDSSLYYARHGFKIARKRKLNPRILDTSLQLADLHRKKANADSALYYLDIALAANDSIFGIDKINELQLFQLEEQRRNHEIEQAKERYQNNIRLVTVVSITAIILVASVFLLRNNRIKQKTNLALQQTLQELKATQSQLVQSEKMASLGELTAGIAHEIQNPLNFVNNFSELNKELICELKNEVGRKNLEEIQSIAINIESNEEKIRHHGQRADAIVKSMLQHSRANSGKKELTDLNVMCDEYVRLAYHGLRSKDKSADVKVETHFDPSLLKVSVVPQDIGRVILNLINNSFYAVIEKYNTSITGYMPTVKISTKQLTGNVEIHVEDNGTGIRDSIKEKIFQPFFTSKPTGQGTGLGLSLSYDIIKAHGGTLDVDSKEGLGSKFIIQLPT